MKHILLTLSLFISVGLSAQQVFYYSNLVEGESAIPIDTHWCRVNNVDQVRVKVNWNNFSGSMHTTGLLTYFLKEGKPYKVTNRKYTEDTTYNVPVYTHGSPMTKGVQAEKDTIEKIIKYTSVGENDYGSWSHFAKAYFNADGKIKDVVYVNSYQDKRRAEPYTISGVRTYNYTGDLIDTVYETPPNDTALYLFTKYEYKAAQAVYVCENEEPDFSKTSKIKSYITYYSKGKKVKLK